MTRLALPPDPAKWTEAQLQRSVIDTARECGWGLTIAQAKGLREESASWGVEAPPLEGLIYHPRYSLGSEPGWPDLTLIRRRDRRLLFAELKGPKGVIHHRQAEVLDLLRAFSGPWIRSPEDPDAHADIATLRVEVHVWRPADLDAIREVLA